MTHQQKSIKWYISVGSCLILFLAIGAFAYMKMNFLLHGVQITANINRDPGSSIVEIKGNAQNAVYLTLNGREIFVDRDGAFTERVALLPGLGVVTLDAQDKFGKTAEKKFELVYRESTGVFAYNEMKINSN